MDCFELRCKVVVGWHTRCFLYFCRNQLTGLLGKLVKMAEICPGIGLRLARLEADLRQWMYLDFEEFGLDSVLSLHPDWRLIVLRSGMQSSGVMLNLVSGLLGSEMTLSLVSGLWGSEVMMSLGSGLRDSVVMASLVFGLRGSAVMRSLVSVLWGSEMMMSLASEVLGSGVMLSLVFD